MITPGDRVQVELMGNLNTVKGVLPSNTTLTGTYAEDIPDGIVHLDNTGGCFISLYKASTGRLYVLDTEVELRLSKLA